jgi:hypothetical protein
MLSWLALGAVAIIISVTFLGSLGGRAEVGLAIGCVISAVLGIAIGVFWLNSILIASVWGIIAPLVGSTAITATQAAGATLLSIPVGVVVSCVWKILWSIFVAIYQG